MAGLDCTSEVISRGDPSQVQAFSSSTIDGRSPFRQLRDVLGISLARRATTPWAGRTAEAHVALALNRIATPSSLEHPEKSEQHRDSSRRRGHEANGGIVDFLLGYEQKQRHADHNQNERHFHYLPR